MDGVPTGALRGALKGVRRCSGKARAATHALILGFEKSFEMSVSIAIIAITATQARSPRVSRNLEEIMMLETLGFLSKGFLSVEMMVPLEMI